MGPLNERAGEFTRDLTFARFNKSSKYQMRKTVFHDDVKGAWISGAMTLSQYILASHEAGHYKDIEEMLGGLHLAIHELWNTFSRENKTLRELTIQEIVEHGHGDLFECVFKNTRQG